MARQSNTDHILPEISEEGKLFWEGCLEGELRIQRCDDCSTTQWFPRSYCRNCQSGNLSWSNGSGHGKVYSFTIVHRPMLPTMAVPYVFAIVELDEGYRMVTNIVECELDQVRIGMPVEVVFEQLVDDNGTAVALPKFRPLRAET